MEKEKVVTAAEMKAIEKAANDQGLLYIQMMENAGRAAWQRLRDHRPGPGNLLVVAGKGNNGGDGFVMARVAAKEGWKVTVWLPEGEPQTQDAITNRNLLKELPVEILTQDTPPSSHGWTAVVDALYGTGFHGALRPAGLKACALMNECREKGAFVVAVDLPSGLSADTGEAAEGAVRVGLTVSFHRLKPVHTTPAAKEYCGTIVLADIGIPADC